MMNTVLVIDMVRGFMEDGNPLFCGVHARKIIPNIQKLLTEQKDSNIIYGCDNHKPDDLEFKMFPPHCIEYTSETEIIAELEDFPGIYLPKTRFSCFFNTDLANRLGRNKPDKLIVCGVCTDICVVHTVADARNRDYEVDVPENCVASFLEANHSTALNHMEKILGAKIV